MRIRLATKLTVLLISTILLVLVVMSGILSWSLRNGFEHYLKEQDHEQLQLFVAAAARQVLRYGEASLAGGPETLRPLVDASLKDAGALPGPGERPRDDRPPGAPPMPYPRQGDTDPEPPPPPRFGGPPGPPPPDRPPPGHPPPGHPPPDRPPPFRPPRADPHAFGPRLALYRPDGQFLGGRRFADRRNTMELPVQVGDKVVAIASLKDRPPAPEGADAHFLKQQLRTIGLTAAALTLLALLIGLVSARRLVRRMGAAQAATHQIATGQFQVRVPVQGQDELADLAGDINAMAATLEKNEQLRRRWIAELSHELRTPLTVLRGEIEALADGVRPLTPEAMASLQSEVTRLTRLTEDFHQLALSDAQALPCHFEPLDLSALLAQTQARFASRARQAGLALSCQLDASALACGQAPAWDAGRIEQLLGNLIENSLRYTDAPGRIEVQVSGIDDKHLRIRVSDSAPGVSQGDLQRLFEPLFRSDPSRSRLSGGSGLGLAVCKAIVHSHAGTIRASAAALGGLQIEMVLPLDPEASAAPNPSTATANPPQ